MAVRASTLFAGVLLGAATNAQDFIDLPWRLAADGRLEVQVGAAPTGNTEWASQEWEPMFPDLLPGEPDDTNGFGRPGDLGVIALVPLLFHGPGGAAAIDDASLRLQKLGIRVSMLPASVHTTTPDPLLDLLRVQHIARGEGAIADMALHAYLDDERRSAFVRAAAARALLDRGRKFGTERNAEAISAALAGRDGPTALQTALERLPDDADLIVGIHTAAMPPATAALAAWRRRVHLGVSEIALTGGGSMSPAQLYPNQVLMDRPGQLPYELATRFGNWRVDYALIALRCSHADAWWFRLGGKFEPGRIANGLAATNAKATIREKDGVVTASAHGWNLSASRDHFEAWQGDLGEGRRGTRAAELRGRAAAGEPPAWLLVPRSSRLWQRGGSVAADLEVRLDAQRASLTASARCSDPDAAARLLDGWKHRQAAWHVDLDAPVARDTTLTWREVQDGEPGVSDRLVAPLRWFQWIGRISGQAEGDTVRWTLAVADLPILDMVRWLPYIGQWRSH